MDRLSYEGKIFKPYQYTEENEFEKDVFEHANEIFGPKAVYVDTKKRIGTDNIISIPDGYLIEFAFSTEPRLYIIENELVILHTLHKLMFPNNRRQILNDGPADEPKTS